MKAWGNSGGPWTIMEGTIPLSWHIIAMCRHSAELPLQVCGGAGVSIPMYWSLWKGRATANSHVIGTDTPHFSRSFCVRHTFQGHFVCEAYLRSYAVLYSSSCERVFRVSFISLDFIIYYYCVGGTHMWHSIHVEDNFVELVLSFHLSKGSGDQTQDVRLDW